MQAKGPPVLDRVARFSYHRRWLILGMWIVLLIGANAVAQSAGGKTSMNFKLPSSDSQRAIDLLTSRFPSQSGATGDVVFSAPGGVAAPAVRTEMDAVFAQVAATPHVVDVVSPYSAQGRAQVSSDGRVAYAEVQFDGQRHDVPQATIDAIKAIANHARAPGVQVALSGDMFASRSAPGATEIIGILAAVVILLVAFGSLLAMGLPLLTALFGIGIGLAGVTILANFFSMPSFASQLAAMIGIGVGIDYALFIVTRYRQALGGGLDPERAVVKAVTTSGKAVLFAGCTVVISLLGLFAMGLAFVRGLAIGAALAVVITMVASVTLLPAVLGFVGRSIDRLSLPWAKPATAASSSRGVWYRWSRLIQRRPVPFAAVGLGVLVILALPVFSLRLGSADAGNLPTSDTTRVAYDMLTSGFGPGFNGPLLLAIEIPGGPADTSAPATIVQLRTAVSHTADVASVGPARISPHGDVAVMQVFPGSGPQDQRTVTLLHDLRRTVIPAATAGTPLIVHVGGQTAIDQDLASFLGSHLPIFIVAVLGLSFLLLLVVFRSVVVPLKAVVMNLLSIGAAYGLLVAVFQWGYGKGLVGVGKTGPIEDFVPMMMFAILFGLSMDYEVFLLSRVKEEWDRTGDNGLAVADGLSHTARVITAAAAIMVCVFGSFVFGGDRVIKEFGLGLAAAIFIDATVVRMVLVPATMELLGNANWWIPKRLERMLPNIHIEGQADDLEAELSTLALEPEPADDRR